MKDDCKGCFGAANNDCDHCEELKEESEQQEIFFTDLTTYFTKNMKDVLIGAWIIQDEKKKELILKFDERISGIEKMVYMQLIGMNLIETAEKQDEAGEADASFRELLDGIRIRQWEATDEERIQRGIPHSITK